MSGSGFARGTGIEGDGILKVTGQTWQSHPDFYRLVMECLDAVPF